METEIDKIITFLWKLKDGGTWTKEELEKVIETANSLRVELEIGEYEDDW